MNTQEEFHPLQYFQELLESNKSEVLIDKFIADFFIRYPDLKHNIKKYDTKKGIILYEDYYIDENGHQDEWGEMDWSFDFHFSSKIKRELEKSKNLINKEFYQLASQGLPHNQLSFFLKDLLVNLESNADEYYNDYPFVKIAINKLLSFVKTFDNSKQNTPNLSYSWNSSDEKETLHSLHKLHTLLQKHYIIDSSIGEFINSFTNEEVKTGIKWLDPARNGKTSKHSLIHFIIALQEENLILENNEIDFNKKIRYVFRDKDGKDLINVSHSKSTYPKETFFHKKIDEIISQLT